jgi:hypothetical protein
MNIKKIKGDWFSPKGTRGMTPQDRFCYDYAHFIGTKQAEFILNCDEDLAYHLRHWDGRELAKDFIEVLKENKGWIWIEQI